MDEATKQAILSAVRSILLGVGSVLAAKGVVDDATVQSMIGSVMVIVPIVWGILDKYRSERLTKAREVIAVNSGIAASNVDPNITPPVPAEAVPAIIKTFAAPATVKGP